MTILVAIYFITLTLYFWRANRGVSIGVYIAAIYALSSICACLLVYNKMLNVNSILYTNSSLRLDIAPTLLYCALITISILPFAKVKIEHIKAPSNRAFYMVSWFLITVAIVSFAASLSQIIMTLQSGLSEIRAMHYAGDIESITAPFPFNIFLLFSMATYLLLPLTLYSLCFMNNRWWFNLLLIFGSLCRVMQGITRADRSEFTLYFMMLILCLILFQRFIHKRQRRFIGALILPIIFIFIGYLASVTIARFGERDSGASGGAIEYAGQSYLNFCYYYEHRNENYKSYERFFPLTCYILLNDVYTPEDREERSLRHGFFTAVFPSFIGVLLLDTGVVFTVVWVVCLYFVTKMCMPRGVSISLGRLLILFTLAVIPMFGVFFYKYNTLSSSLFLAVVFLIYIVFKYRFVIK